MANEHVKAVEAALLLQLDSGSERGSASGSIVFCESHAARKIAAAGRSRTGGSLCQADNIDERNFPWQDFLCAAAENHSKVHVPSQASSIIRCCAVSSCGQPQVNALLSSSLQRRSSEPLEEYPDPANEFVSCSKTVDAPISVV
jgi:hypothetical protein